MGDENYLGKETILEGNVKAALKASEEAVQLKVAEYYLDKGAINFPSATRVNMDTRAVNNTAFVGFLTSVWRSYGPTDSKEAPLEIDQALEGNTISLDFGLAAKDQKEHIVVEDSRIRQIQTSLEICSQMRETGFSFEVSVTKEPIDNENPFGNETVLLLTEIAGGKEDLGISININLGPDSEFSKLMQNDEVIATTELAEVDSAEGALVVKGIIPRSPGIITEVKLTNGDAISADDPDIEKKLWAGALVSARALEIIGEELSGEPVFIEFTPRSSEEMLNLDEDDPAFDWIRDLDLNDD